MRFTTAESPVSPQTQHTLIFVYEGPNVGPVGVGMACDFSFEWIHEILLPAARAEERHEVHSSNAAKSVA